MKENINVINKECCKEFNTNKISLNKRIHSGEKPYVCEINNCEKRFTQKSNLIRHKRRHLDIREHKCYYNKCNKCFVTKYENLNNTKYSILNNNINNMHTKE